jgi:hypothetical protein
LTAVGSVAVSGDGTTAFVGQYSASSVYEYTWSGGAWTYANTISTSFPARLGASSDGTTLVSTDGYDFHTYQKTSGTWSQVDLLSLTGNDSLDNNIRIKPDASLMCVSGWDTSTGQRYLWTYQRSGLAWSRVDSINTGPNSTRLMIGGFDASGYLYVYYTNDSTTYEVRKYVRSGASWSLVTTTAVSSYANINNISDFVADYNTGATWFFGHSSATSTYYDGVRKYVSAAYASTINADFTDGTESIFGQAVDVSSDGSVLVANYRNVTANQFGFYYTGGGSPPPPPPPPPPGTSVFWTDFQHTYEVP